MWIDQFMNATERKRVESAVQQAEQSTTGEIVTMIVRRSTGVGHVGPILFLILLLLLSVGDFFILRYENAVNELLFYFFGSSISFEIFLIIFTLLFFISIIAISSYLARFAVVQRLLTADSDLEFQALERAQLEFYWSKTNQTRERTGILIFLSLMEHRCIVLADEAIAKKLPPETWQKVVDEVLVGVKSQRPADGLIKAVHTCGSILSQHFPGQSSGPNELSNLLIIKD